MSDRPVNGRCGECDHLLSRHTPKCTWGTCSCANARIRLTKREYEALTWFAKGLMFKEVAVKMGCVPKTVEVHRYNMLKKAGVHGMAQMVLAAVQSGLLTKEDLPTFEIPVYGPSS